MSYLKEFDVSFSEEQTLTAIGVESVVQTQESTEDNGVNTLEVTLTDGTKSEFNVRNGSQGAGANAVIYTPQDLTKEKKAQARDNISALADAAVCVSYEQPTDPEAQIWYNPNGAVCTVQEKEEVSTPSVVAGIVGLALSEMLNNTAARYATIEDALAGASTTADGKVLAYTCGGKFNIMLLDDIASAATINITKDCTLHLNGKTLSFTKAGTYLNINTASEVTINGMVADSAIVKSGVTGSGIERLISTTETHLIMLGGTYSMTDISASAIIPIRTESAATKIDMNGCAVLLDVPCGIRGTQFKGVSAINNCQFRATSQGTECTAIYAITGDMLTVTNSTIATECTGADCTVIGISSTTGESIITNCHVEVSGESASMVCGIASTKELTVTNCHIEVSSESALTAFGIEVAHATNEQAAIENCTIYTRSFALRANIYGVKASSKNIIVTNCHIEADGFSDTESEEGVVTAYGVYPISTGRTTTITINGGYYWGARDGLSISGTARINGGLFEGCQHGGAYLSGHDIKAKNAIFRNVPYEGTVGWLDGQNPGGALYCGSGYIDPDTNKYAETNVYLDNCRIETTHYTWYGLVAKYNNTNVYLSNCVLDIIDSVHGELRADAHDTIYIGKNVPFDATKVQLNNGTLDTTTYADQEFGFETEATTSHAILSVKDERGNWVGIA